MHPTHTLFPQVYRREYQLGGAMQFAYHADGHLTEASPLLTDANRLKIFDSWKPFWNMSMPVLVEKSPRHSIATRFLQSVFTPEASRFLFIMRHPLAASHYQWFRNRKSDEAKTTCGRPWVEHWLQIHRLFLEDIPHLRQVAVFQYERLLAGAPLLQDARALTQGWLHALYAFLDLETDQVRAKYMKDALPGEPVAEGLYALMDLPSGAAAPAPAGSPKEAGDDDAPPGIKPRIRPAPAGAAKDDDDDEYAPGKQERRRRLLGTGPDNGAAQGQRRKLQEFYGRSRFEVKINDRLVYNWVPQWLELVDLQGPVCQKLIADHEAELNRFGYSLVHLTFARPPPAFDGYHLRLHRP
jgi:hypothetical protein